AIWPARCALFELETKGSSHFFGSSQEERMRRAPWCTTCTTLLLALCLSMLWTTRAGAADSSFSRNLKDTVDRMQLPPADPHVPMQTATTSPDSATLCPTQETACPAVETRCPTVATRCPPADTKCPAADTRCPT